MSKLDDKINREMHTIILMANEINNIFNLYIEVDNPELKLEYMEEFDALVKSYNTLGKLLKKLIEEHYEYCNNNDVPYNLNYHRVYKELLKE